MLIEPFAALKGVWDFDNPNIAIIDGVVVGPGRLLGTARGRPHGHDREWLVCARLASWDGVGASDYSGYTLQGTVSVPLN